MKFHKENHQNRVEIHDFRDNNFRPEFKLFAIFQISSSKFSRNSKFRFRLSILIFTLGQQHFKAQAELRKSIHSYDIRDAKLHVEADREMILQFIDELFQTPG